MCGADHAGVERTHDVLDRHCARAGIADIGADQRLLQRPPTPKESRGEKFHVVGAMIW